MKNLELKRLEFLIKSLNFFAKQQMKFLILIKIMRKEKPLKNNGQCFLKDVKFCKQMMKHLKVVQMK